MPVIVEHESVKTKNLKEFKTQLELFNQEASSHISEPYSKVKMESIMKMKESTKKLLALLEHIQNKGYQDGNADNELQTLDALQSATNIEIQEEFDDCSIYKRLTRKCNCMNQQEYNDFMIHFNDAPNNITSPIAEIIKNLKILKKFMYMGGDYTVRALLFLNEGLQKSSYHEKADIIQGCAHADMCNVFEPHSIISTCIALQCESDRENRPIQIYTAEFVNQLAQIEEGRRYLNYTSRVINDIKKVLKKKADSLDLEVINSLNVTLNLLQTKALGNNTIACSFIENRHQKFPTKHISAQYKNFGYHTLLSLSRSRQHMTLDEIFAHLDILCNLSFDEKGKVDLKSGLPIMVPMFIAMVKKYNNSELNILITTILENILTKESKNVVCAKETCEKNSQPTIESQSGRMDAATKVEHDLIDECCQVTLIKPKDETTSFLRFQDTTQKQQTRKKEAAHSNIIIVPIEKRFSSKNNKY